MRDLSPKQKAEELFHRFNKEGLHQISAVINRHVRKAMIKQCVLIHIEELQKAIDWHELEYPNREFIYYDSVKEEVYLL